MNFKVGDKILPREENLHPLLIAGNYYTITEVMVYFDTENKRDEVDVKILSGISKSENDVYWRVGYWFYSKEETLQIERKQKLLKLYDRARI